MTIEETKWGCKAKIENAPQHRVPTTRKSEIKILHSLTSLNVGNVSNNYTCALHRRDSIYSARGEFSSTGIRTNLEEKERVKKDVVAIL